MFSSVVECLTIINVEKGSIKYLENYFHINVRFINEIFVTK